MRLLLAIFFLFSSACCSKILLVVLTNSKSHLGSMAPFAQALSKNGHNVTVYVETLTDLGELKNGVKKHYVILPKETINKAWGATFMNIVWNGSFAPEVWKGAFGIGNTALLYAMKQESFWQIANQTWDFIVSDEIFTPTGWAMGMIHKERHGTPHAVFSTTAMLHAYTHMLSLNRNPVIAPSYYLSVDDPLSWNMDYFVNRAISVRHAIVEYSVLRFGERVTRSAIEQMGYSGFSWSNYYHDASMVLIDYPDRLAWPVPVAHDFVYTGSSCPDSRPLPDDLEEFVSDPTSKGTILVAFGSHVQWDIAPRRVVLAFLEVLNNMSDYRVIWSYRGSPLDAKSHVKLQEWVPQNDLLNHPKTRLFFSHGGLKSVKEAICSETPVLYMPLFCEQVRSSFIANQLGFAEYVNKNTVSAQEIYAQMSKVLANDSYRRGVAKVKSLFLDRIMDPLQEAVFCTEKLIRFGSTQMMKRAGMRLNWFQFLYVDLTVLIFGVTAFLGCTK
uniref:UDP-glucuronosyltransferase n=1 Tax=Plectus sambesii TaxID=2011161 RepID=A0A914W2F6_9BILA